MLIAERCIQLYAVYEEKVNIQVNTCIRRNGSFHAKGTFAYRQAYGSKEARRCNDRHFFNYWCGKEYMKGKEVHHEWETGEVCFVLEIKEHRRLHYGFVNSNTE